MAKNDLWCFDLSRIILEGKNLIAEIEKRVWSLCETTGDIPSREKNLSVF